MNSFDWNIKEIDDYFMNKVKELSHYLSNPNNFYTNSQFRKDLINSGFNKDNIGIDLFSSILNERKYYNYDDPNLKKKLIKFSLLIKEHLNDNLGFQLNKLFTYIFIQDIYTIDLNKIIDEKNNFNEYYNKNNNIGLIKLITNEIIEKNIDSNKYLKQNFYLNEETINKVNKNFNKYNVFKNEIGNKILYIITEKNILNDFIKIDIKLYLISLLEIDFKNKFNITKIENKIEIKNKNILYTNNNYMTNKYLNNGEIIKRLKEEKDIDFKEINLNDIKNDFLKDIKNAIFSIYPNLININDIKKHIRVFLYSNELGSNEERSFKRYNIVFNVLGLLDENNKKNSGLTLENLETIKNIIRDYCDSTNYFNFFEGKNEDKILQNLAKSYYLIKPEDVKNKFEIDQIVASYNSTRSEVFIGKIIGRCFELYNEGDGPGWRYLLTSGGYVGEKYLELYKID